MDKIQTVSDASRISKGLATLSLSARKELKRGLDNIIHLYNSGDKAKKSLYFSAAQELFIDLTNKYGTAAQVIAIEALEAQGIPLKTVTSIYQMMNAGSITEKAIQSSNGGIEYLSGALDNAVKRGYRDTVMDNADGWARVPVGSYTCPWCVMLASRGFVYKSEGSAGGTGRYHNYCDCALVPAKKGATLDGYNPDELYDLYLNDKGIGERPDRKTALDTSGNEI